MIFDSATALGTVVSLGTAFVLGSMIGIERQLRQRNAGLRTLTLVAVGAAAFVHLGSRLLEAEGEIRIIAYVVSGIGFLGAGVIMKEGAQIRGLNTAATLWSTAAVGAFAGAGLLVESAIVAAFVLGSNTLLRPLVNALAAAQLAPEKLRRFTRYTYYVRRKPCRWRATCSTRSWSAPITRCARLKFCQTAMT
jgi:putative Mg2+ transporter-C (MgtC) family protein